jgi:hypothetical protein
MQKVSATSRFGDEGVGEVCETALRLALRVSPIVCLVSAAFLSYCHWGGYLLKVSKPATTSERP